MVSCLPCTSVQDEQELLHSLQANDVVLHIVAKLKDLIVKGSSAKETKKFTNKLFGYDGESVYQGTGSFYSS